MEKGGRGKRKGGEVGLKQARNGFRTFAVLRLPLGVSFPHTPHMTAHAVRSLSYIPSRKRKENREKRNKKRL